ncbi:hypothetical protein KRMM14A1004_16100 [Krasilnikovia sp. MM14-A1004]
MAADPAEPDPDFLGPHEMKSHAYHAHDNRHSTTSGQGVCSGIDSARRRARTMPYEQRVAVRAMSISRGGDERGF